MPKNSYKFFSNKECKYFPCHKGIHGDNFSCFFCYCPLYPYSDCGGNYTILPNGIKDCSNCLIPHNGEQGWEYITKKLMEKAGESRENNMAKK